MSYDMFVSSSGGGSTCCRSNSYDDTSCNVTIWGNDFSYKRGPPSSNDGSSDILAITAKELNAMSIEDREKIFEEVNGIPTTTEEDTEFITNCLERLEDELERVPLDKSAYERALRMRPELRHDRTFQKMFLRSECFDVRKTARRMIKYFQSKRILFGDSLLAKHIEYDDLDQEDQTYLATGAFQILNSKDQAGRTVAFISLKQSSFKSWQNQVNTIKCTKDSVTCTYSRETTFSNILYPNSVTLTFVTPSSFGGIGTK